MLTADTADRGSGVTDLPAGQSPCVPPIESVAVPRPDHPRRVGIFRLTMWLMDLFMIAPVARRRYLVGPLPPTGPLLVAPNHISWFDTIAVGAALTRAGRIPRFVIMEQGLRWPIVGAILRFFDHIPLDRAKATDPTLLDPVRDALRRGECVVFYAEGGVTQREDYLPGRPLPGLGVLAAELCVPVVPVAQWGAQYVLGRGQLAWRRFPPRRAKLVITSLPVMEPPSGAGVLAARRFTGKVMDAVTAAVLRLREILDEPAGSTEQPARPARPVRRPRRGDVRS